MAGLLSLGLLVQAARGSMIRPDADLDQYRTGFQLEIDQALKLFAESSDEDFFARNFQLISGITERPGYKAQTLSDCEELKTRLILSAPIDPFAIRQDRGYVLETPFCERQPDYQKTEYGLLEESSHTVLGAIVEKIFVIMQSEPSYLGKGEESRIGQTAYFFDQFSQLIGILSVEVTQRVTDDKFPSFDLRWSEVRPDGSIIHLKWDASGRMEQFYPIDGRNSLITRTTAVSDRQNSQKSEVETITAYRVDDLAWLREALLLPVIHEHSRDLRGERQLSENGLDYGYRSKKDSWFTIKRLGGRELCSFGYQSDQTTRPAGRVQFPKSPDDYAYCSSL